MKHCSLCQTRYEDRVDFCFRDGTPLTEGAGATTASDNVLPAVGEDIDLSSAATRPFPMHIPASTAAEGPANQPFSFNLREAAALGGNPPGAGGEDDGEPPVSDGTATEPFLPFSSPTVDTGDHPIHFEEPPVREGRKNRRSQADGEDDDLAEAATVPGDEDGPVPSPEPEIDVQVPKEPAGEEEPAPPPAEAPAPAPPAVSGQVWPATPKPAAPPPPRKEATVTPIAISIPSSSERGSPPPRPAPRATPTGTYVLLGVISLLAIVLVLWVMGRSSEAPEGGEEEVIPAESLTLQGGPAEPVPGEAVPPDIEAAAPSEPAIAAEEKLPAVQPNPPSVAAGTPREATGRQPASPGEASQAIARSVDFSTPPSSQGTPVASPSTPDQPAAKNTGSTVTSASRPGTLNVRSNPTYATVLVDGRKIGSTPLYNVEVQPGRHILRVELAGYVAKETTIELAPGDFLSPPVMELEPQAAAKKKQLVEVRLNAAPEGVKVYANAMYVGEHQASVPLYVQLPEGSHVFKVIKPDGTILFQVTKNVKATPDGQMPVVVLSP